MNLEEEKKKRENITRLNLSKILVKINISAANPYSATDSPIKYSPA